MGVPAYQSGVIPANTYEGQTTNVPTAYVQNFLVTRADAPVDMVYTMTKSLFEHLDQLKAAHAAAKSIRKEAAAAGMPLPLHPGAEKYYREIGVLK